MASHHRTPGKRLVSEPKTVVYEESPRWIRGYYNNTIVVDSKKAYLVWEGTNHIPFWAFPIKDIQGLEPNNNKDGGREGIRNQWYDVKVGSETISNFAWTIHKDTPGFIPGAEDVAIVASPKLDHWREDDETIYGHPRSPYARIDVRASSRHVRVDIDGVTVAETKNAIFLYENGLPTRFYINTIDVKRIDLFHPVSLNTICPYKGSASYFSAVVNGKNYENIVWTYLEPFEGLERVKGRWCFYNEKLDIYVDGEKA